MVSWASHQLSTGAVSDAAFAQIIRGQLNGDLVTGENADLVLAHLAGDMCGDDIPILQLYPEHGVGKGLRNSPLHLDEIFFGHSASCCFRLTTPTSGVAVKTKPAIIAKKNGKASRYQPGYTKY